MSTAIIIVLLIGAAVSAIVGAVIFAAGMWFRHRYIIPESPPVQPLPGNSWSLPGAGIEREGRIE